MNRSESTAVENTTEPAIRINVSPANPGQFFACCGLLELADRLWSGAEGCFDPQRGDFAIAGTSTDGDGKPSLLDALATCKLTNTMTAEQLQRLETLKEMRPPKGSPEEDEKKALEKLKREAPLVLHEPFNLRLDWFLDERAGGSRFKTWAGQQSVIDIARSMKQPIEDGAFADVPAAEWLRHASGHAVSFNLDADQGAQSSALDVGFSLDPLGMSSETRPLLELAAFIGLQRFRPAADDASNRYTYRTWTTRLPPEAAAAACGGHIATPGARSFAFPLLYRTKYLKSFLPAQPVRGDR